MSVDIAKLRKLFAAAKDSVYGSRVADEYVAALCHAAPGMLDELERLRKWCKASIDADQVLCSENARLRRFRDAVMEFASVTSIGNACWSKRSFEVFPTLGACIADERAALAKESGNGV